MFIESLREVSKGNHTKNELLEIAYDSQTTLMSSAITLHSQGEQIRDAVKKMDMLHSDLEVGENIVNDMESWFGYWKISHKKQSVISGQEFSILAAKTQQESHIPSKIILASNSINIYSLKDKELFSFGTNDIGNTLVHSPFEVTFVQRRIGKPDIKAHVVSTELPNLLRCLEKLYKKKLSYEKPQFSSDDEDDENDKEDGYAESYLASSSSKREQLFDGSINGKYGGSETAKQSQNQRQKQQKVLSESEANELSGVIKSMKEMALDIKCEQDVQDEQLDKLGFALEKADAKVKKDNQVIRSMLRK